MSLATITPSPGDFDAWEQELDQPRRLRSRAAQRRQDREAIARGQGYRRHRKTEREQ